MKAILLILSGFLVTIGGFAGGAVYAVSLLSVNTAAEPRLDMDRNSAWTSQPVTVAGGSELTRSTQLEVDGSDDRIKIEAHLAKSSPEPAALDETLTASLTVDPVADAPIAKTNVGPMLSSAHLDWCARRYRSYDANTNAYRSYSGRARPCRSPFETTDAADFNSPRVISEDPEPREALLVEVGLTDDHAAECAARYRSYRASDNTYQPLSGGPRRVCR